MNKRFLSILSALPALGVIGTSFLGGINPAEARSRNSWLHDVPMLPGQRRIKYKSSDIVDADVINLCRDNTSWGHTYIGFKREGHQVRCLYVYEHGEIGGHGGVGVVIKDGNYMIGTDFKAYDNPKYTPVQKAFPTDDICERKHPGDGTYSIEGGKACEDSYRKNPWEK